MDDDFNAVKFPEELSRKGRLILKCEDSMMLLRT